MPYSTPEKKRAWRKRYYDAHHKWDRSKPHGNMKHGHHKEKASPTYQSWKTMKKRCLNPNHKDYHNYGGRGITICKRWLNSFENFLADMGERPLGLTLDRKNNNGNYNKRNCRWATDDEQANNKRPFVMTEARLAARRRKTE